MKGSWTYPMKSTTLRRWATIVASVLAPTLSTAGDTYPQWLELGHRVDQASSLGKGRLAAIDLDGDGIDEIVLGGILDSESGEFSRYSVLLTPRKASDGSLDMTSRLLSSGIGHGNGFLRVLPWSLGGTPHVVTLGTDGIVRIHDASFREIRSFAAAAETNATAPATGTSTGFPGGAAVIGDVDADGQDELIVAWSDRIVAFSMANGQQRWSYPIYGIFDLALAQLDADPALEIIAAGQNVALVLDGATQATDWSYIEGFGLMVTTGRFGTTDTAGWATTAGGAFTVFQSLPFSPVWSGGQGLTLAALATLSTDEERDDILTSDGRYIYRYGSATHAQKLRFPISPEPSSSNIVSLAGHRFDAGAADEIVSASTTWGESALTIADATTGTTRWKWRATHGPYLATAFGDIDGDGREELVAASRQPQQELGALSIFDAAAGRLKWRSPIDWPSASSRFLLSTSRIQLRPRIGSSGMDIVLAGAEYEGGRILVVDGTTFQQTLRIESLTNRAVSDLALVDYDDDGVEDFAVVSNDFFTSTIDVFSGIDGSLLWRSPAMTGRAVQISIIEANGRIELVAAFDSGLRAFDRLNGLLSWSLTANASIGALHVVHGAQGAEIVVLSREGTLAFHDANTRTLLRTQTVNAPVSAAAALDGDIRNLLVATGDRLVLFDGVTGQRLAESAPLAPFTPSRPLQMEGARLSLRYEGGAAWTVAFGTQGPLYRHRLILGGHIFSAGFDPL